MNPPIDRNRLGRVLGLLGSDHDGEVLAAARQAERMRRDAGLTWPQILSPPIPSPQPPALSVEAAIRFARSRHDLLTTWEHDFVESLRRQRYPLSERQIEILNGIVVKIRRAPLSAAA